MPIAIQASDLDHARIDGTRVYLKELLKRFGHLDANQDFLIYHKQKFNPLLAPPELPNYQVRSLVSSFSWMQTRFAYELFQNKPEKLFLPIQAAPVFLPKEIEVTATIHDLAFKKYPETFPKKHLWKLNFLLDTVVKRADKLIAVSESTKNDLLEFFPQLSEKKIKVIHHGFDDSFYSLEVPQKELTEELAKYELVPGSYCLYVGALQPRKNLVRLIHAFESVKEKHPEMKLVLAGESAWLTKSIFAAYENSKYKTDIILTGRVNFEELRDLYQGARVFVFPSLYEGFGLPLLEAFASRVAVLTADNSSLREVAGNAAFYCRAENTEDIAEKLQELWQNEELRRRLIEQGTERLTEFSWDICAKETLAYIQG